MTYAVPRKRLRNNVTTGSASLQVSEVPKMGFPSTLVQVPIFFQFEIVRGLV